MSEAGMGIIVLHASRPIVEAEKNLLNERGGNNDTSTKVTSEEVDVEWNTNPANACSDDREEGCHGRDNHNDKQRRDAHAYRKN